MAKQYVIESKVSNDKRMPKISTYYPFDYKDMLSKAKYAFMYHRCGNQANETRPYVVLSENKKLNKCLGYGISIYNNRIEINSEFSVPKDCVDTETLTTDVNGLLCDWLTQQGEHSLINGG